MRRGISGRTTRAAERAEAPNRNITDEGRDLSVVERPGLRRPALVPQRKLDGVAGMTATPSRPP